MSFQDDPVFEFEDDNEEERDCLMTEQNPDLPDKEGEMGKTSKFDEVHHRSEA